MRVRQRRESTRFPLSWTEQQRPLLGYRFLEFVGTLQKSRQAGGQAQVVDHLTVDDFGVRLEVIGAAAARLFARRCIPGAAIPTV